MNKRLAQQNNSTKTEWEIDDEGISWFWDLYQTLFYDMFTSKTFQELGFYFGLTAFFLIGYGILHHYNVQHEYRMLDLAEKMQREGKNKEDNKEDKKEEIRENSSKSNIKVKTD